MELTVSLVPSALTAPLIEGVVAVEGARIVAAKSVDDNSRRMLQGAFDAAEMSLATFVRAVYDGAQLIGLPVFPGRRFVQAGVLVRRDAGIGHPRELAGRRVALPQYWLTSSVWHRGVLREEYGVDEKAVHWLTLAPERGGAPFPQNVHVTACAGASIAELLAHGRADAALVPRPTSPELERAGAVCLFADVGAAQRDYYARTGVFPIMHFIAMRKAAFASEPRFAAAFGAAFQRAKHMALREPARRLALESPLAGLELEAALALLEGDLWPIGLERNRSALASFTRYAREQGLASVLPPLEKLFVPDTTMEHAHAA